MSNENTKPATVAAPVVAAPVADPRIAQLQAQVDKLQAELDANLANATSAPTGDYVVLKGKTYAVERTVEAKFASDEWRKGYIDTDEELVVLKRP